MKKKSKMIERKLFLFLTIAFFSLTSFAQQDSITAQRKARKLIREGNKLYEKQKFTESSVAYQKALSNNPNYDKASYNLGNALYQGKNFTEAAPQFELSAKTAEDKFTKAEAFHNLGNTMMETKNYQAAVNAYKNALRNNPNDDETRYNLAVAQKMLKNQQQQNKNDKNKNQQKDQKEQDKDNKDDQNQDKDNKKDGDDQDKKDKDKDNEKDKGDQDKEKKNPKDNDDKKDPNKKPKPQQGKMSPQQVKQLLESLNNEEKKTQKKMNAKKAKGRKTKQEKDW